MTILAQLTGLEIRKVIISGILTSDHKKLITKQSDPQMVTYGMRDIKIKSHRNVNVALQLMQCRNSVKHLKSNKTEFQMITETRLLSIKSVTCIQMLCVIP